MSTVYILIELPKQKRNRDLTNLRRYLKNHEFNQLETDCPMKVLSRLIDPEPDYYEKFNIPKEEDQKEDYEPIVKESTHQDLLENWARQTFSENSAEMKLLFESEHDQENEIECNDEIDEVESEESNSRSRKRANSFSVDEMIRRENHEHHRAKRSLSFDAAIREDEQEEERSQPSVQTISSDSSPENFYLSDDSDTIVEDYDEKRMFMGGDEDYTETKSISNDHSMCDICEKYVKVGRAKKSQLRAQLYHVVDVHTLDTVRLDHLNRRYQCESCYKNLSAFVSPCDHISQYHSKDDAEIKFNDRWSEQQISECNRYLKLCFRRGLPVPRGRRVTNGFSRKSNYVINSRKTTETGETSSTTTLNTMHVQKRQQHSFSSLEPKKMSNVRMPSPPREYDYDYQDSSDEDEDRERCALQ